MNASLCITLTAKVMTILINMKNDVIEVTGQVNDSGAWDMNDLLPFIIRIHLS